MVHYFQIRVKNSELEIEKEAFVTMKLSTKGRYGLRALIDLAVHSQDGAVSIQSIAKRQSISDNYLEQLMANLKKAGLVTISRGACGGYRLAVPASEISVGDVLRALEGDLKAVTCAGNEPESTCEGADLCVTRVVWKKINDSIAHTVDTMMLEELVEESRKLVLEKGVPKNQGCCSEKSKK